MRHTSPVQDVGRPIPSNSAQPSQYEPGVSRSARFATLRVKTVLIIATTQLVLLAVFYVLLRVYWLGSFVDLEAQMLTTDMNRARNSVQNELHALAMLNAGYAIWDDTYAFAGHYDQAYVDKNYYDELFSDSRLNLVLIVDPLGRVLFGKTYSLTDRPVVPLPERLQQLSPHDPLLEQLTLTNSITGVLQLPTAPMLIASHAIVTSAGEGPARGAVIMGRYLDAPEIESLGNAAQLSFQVYTRNQPQAPDDLAAAWRAIDQGQPLLLQPLSDQLITAAAPLPDLDRRANLLLRVTTARSIYAQGQRGIDYFILVFLGTGVLFGAILLLLLERAMLARLAYFHTQVGHIGRRGDLSMRVKIGGGDELSSLAGAFNSTLAALEQAQATQTQLYQEARASEQKYRAILDAIPDMMFRISADGTYIDAKIANTHAVEMQPVALRGKTVHEIVMPALAQQTMDFVGQALATDLVQSFEVPLDMAGQQHDFEVRIVRSGDDEVLAIMRDITERKRFERMQRDFITVVSHELRTPLTALRGALGLLGGGVVGELPERAQAMIHIAKNNTERLMLLINDILDIEKLESGTLTFVKQRLELSQLVEHAIEINQPYGLQFGVQFRFAPGAPEAWIDADEHRLVQVLSNLLSNAAKFSPTGAEVLVSLASTAGRVRVCVTDHGAGIPESFRPRIFTKFAQASAEDGRQRGGTGLGLSISRSIVEQLGGVIGYETEPGRGTTFYFELPAGQLTPE